MFAQVRGWCYWAEFSCLGAIYVSCEACKSAQHHVSINILLSVRQEILLTRTVSSLQSRGQARHSEWIILYKLEIWDLEKHIFEYICLRLTDLHYLHTLCFLAYYWYLNLIHGQYLENNQINDGSKGETFDLVIGEGEAVSSVTLPSNGLL